MNDRTFSSDQIKITANNCRASDGGTESQVQSGTSCYPHFSTCIYLYLYLSAFIYIQNGTSRYPQFSTSICRVHQKECLIAILAKNLFQGLNITSGHFDYMYPLRIRKKVMDSSAGQHRLGWGCQCKDDTVQPSLRFCACIF